MTLTLDFVGTQAARAPLQDGLRRCCVCGAAFATPLGSWRMAQFPESKFTFQILNLLVASFPHVHFHVQWQDGTLIQIPFDIPELSPCHRLRMRDHLSGRRHCTARGLREAMIEAREVDC